MRGNTVLIKSLQNLSIYFQFTPETIALKPPDVIRRSDLKVIWMVLVKKCLNVRQKLGTRSHTHSFSHSHTHSISHSITLDMLNNFCFHVYAQNSPSHFLTLNLSCYLTLTLSHSHTLSISHSITLDMLNKFCFHV